MPSTLKISKKTSTNSFTQDQELSLKPTMVLVLGMHRSGTSVTARLMECLGAKNSDILMRPTEGNPEGSFEDTDIYEFNERKLLPRLRRAWHSVGSVDWTALSAADRGKYALEALEILRKNYSLSNPLSVLKEPRICILLPFWLSVFQHAGFNVKVTCVVRDPVSVVRSLSKKEGLSLAHSGILFVNYWISILNYIQDLPVAFVQYDEIFVNPAKSLRDVAQKLSLPYPKDFEERVHAFSSSFFDKKLRHSTLQSCDLALETDLPPLAIELYESLLAGAQAQNVKKTAKFVEYCKKWVLSLQPSFLEFDRLFVQFHGANHRAKQLQAALDSEKSSADREQLTGLEGEKERLEHELVRAQAEAAQERGQHAAIAGEAEALRQELGEVTARVGALQQEAVGYREQLKTSETELNEAKQNIQERFEELATLSRMHISVDDERNRLAAEIVIIKNESHARASHITHLEGLLAEKGGEIEKIKDEASGIVMESHARASHITQLEAWLQEKAGLLDGYIRESAQMAKRIVLLQKEKEASRKIGHTACAEEVFLGVVHESGEHQHVNYSFHGITHLGRQFSRIDARIVEHRGNPGFAIFEPVAKERPFYNWEKHGEENSGGYMLIIPAENKGADWLVRATTNDLLLFRDLVAIIHQQIMFQAPDGKWNQVCTDLLRSLIFLPERLHYDDVKLVSREKGFTKVKIVNPSHRLHLLPYEVAVFKGKKLVSIEAESDAIECSSNKLSFEKKQIKNLYAQESKNILFHIK
jgi:hypothetical protein